eukprot:TRINITY_DN5973_c0_g1_i3.p1 TRINITY_DN5973_c0_g1~~TRINITY_DN5973_c0_g1_i3.p1  ORF type:complete len:713 (-),score=178.54 TRINITY_DN5973_c0_g1_i3:100-2238(-)
MENDQKTVTKTDEQIAQTLILDFFKSHGWNDIVELLEQKIECTQMTEDNLSATSLHALVDTYAANLGSGSVEAISEQFNQLNLEGSDHEDTEITTHIHAKRRNTPPLMFLPPNHRSDELQKERVNSFSTDSDPDAQQEIDIGQYLADNASGSDQYPDVLSRKSSSIFRNQNSDLRLNSGTPLSIPESTSVQGSEGVDNPEDHENEFNEKDSEDTDDEPSGVTTKDFDYYVPADEDGQDEWTDDNDCGYRVIRMRTPHGALPSLTRIKASHPIEDQDFDEEEKDAEETKEFYSAQIQCEDPPSSIVMAKLAAKTRIEATVPSPDMSEENPELLKEIEKMHELVLSQTAIRVVYETEKTGFEPTEDFDISVGRVVASRYQILEYIGSAAFSRAVKCIDLQTGYLVCLKIIRNNKSFIDQTFDEFKILCRLNEMDPECVYPIVRCVDCFYYKEHLFLVTELLKSNLYELFTYHQESGYPNYFTIPRLRRITRQLLAALHFVHSIDLIHCDLKPENILMQSISRCAIKLIDFGSSCYTADFHTSYVQSRSYRAPEVVLGCAYGKKADIWSLGCILAELYTGYVLFQNISLSTMMTRIVSVLGPLPVRLVAEGKHTQRIINENGTFYEHRSQGTELKLLLPKKTSLAHRLRSPTNTFYDFVKSLLELDPATRPTAAEAMAHPWLQEIETEEECYYDLIAVQRAAEEQKAAAAASSHQ